MLRHWLKGLESTELLGPPDSQKSRYGTSQLRRIRVDDCRLHRLTTPRAILASGESPFGVALSLPFWPVFVSVGAPEPAISTRRLTWPPADRAPNALMHVS